jgi:hypothetical protein
VPVTSDWNSWRAGFSAASNAHQVAQIAADRATDGAPDVPRGVQRVMVMVAMPDRPSLSAVIRTEPADIAVTSPVADTMAMLGASLLQATTRPNSGVPLVSRVDAASRSVSPTVASDVSGDTTTVVT